MLLSTPPLSLSTLTASKYSGLLIALVVTVLALRRRWNPKRLSVLPKHQERVVILGATSGIGRVLAQQYAKRGARVCVVGRRAELLAEVKTECCILRDPSIERSSILPASHVAQNDAIFAVQADLTAPEDAIHTVGLLRSVWGGVDTVIICAGVSSLRPLLEVAGVERPGEDVSLTGIRRIREVSDAAMKGNFTGPLLSAVSLIPLLESTSRSPSVALISSAAAIIPAPTRSLYCASKAASLILFQSLAIEHPKIKFTNVMPATVEGDFRASAVDAGPVRESSPNKHGLKRDYVAQRIIKALDYGEKEVFLPWWFVRLGHLFYWIVPSVIEVFSRKKYNFTPAT
ncbi:NAD(P)-binding protein [Phanerochaete sordida]|uniref:NAD(P)-binding protein n=1 Tax=Phanerochaete sordida TaxID=48140 RepID=A0A9P3GCA2_9APHY|nr:NAD(P)-binding protein [Phanerochaete sordida]